ncbi:MAG: hypothetical protein JNJ95_06145 [Dechloromonas sp.]|nr:hypothetical protein [Dechloromonas sp.]
MEKRRGGETPNLVILDFSRLLQLYAAVRPDDLPLDRLRYACPSVLFPGAFDELPVRAFHDLEQFVGLFFRHGVPRDGEGLVHRGRQREALGVRPRGVFQQMFQTLADLESEVQMLQGMLEDPSKDAMTQKVQIPIGRSGT